MAVSQQGATQARRLSPTRKKALLDTNQSVQFNRVSCSVALSWDFRLLYLPDNERKLNDENE
jgi:hypothetical protein